MQAEVEICKCMRNASEASSVHPFAPCLSKWQSSLHAVQACNGRARRVSCKRRCALLCSRVLLEKPQKCVMPLLACQCHLQRDCRSGAHRFMLDLGSNESCPASSTSILDVWQGVQRALLPPSSSSTLHLLQMCCLLHAVASCRQKHACTCRHQ